MTDAAAAMAPAMMHPAHAASAFRRNLLIGVIAFLTVVDLFATQAILPSLARAYGVSPAAMGFAVNASTIGMAVAGLVVALLSHRIDRRRGIVASLVLLSIPTALLAVAPSLPVFTALRIVQGVFMSAAFTLMLAYLGEECSARDAAGAFAAYITGNVASNLLGRLMSAAVADHLGLASNFLVFALLNLAGGMLVALTLHRTMPQAPASGSAPFKTWLAHWRNPTLRAGFGIGFCVLFAFLGIFTYVNFVLVSAPFSLSPMMLGFVYFVFLPAIVTTPLAGGLARRFGARPSLWAGLGVAAIGLPLLVLPSLPAVIVGLVLVGVGTFFAQATATGTVSRAATSDRAGASGIYLASYYCGGVAGSAVLGRVHDAFGWTACVSGVAIALGVAAAFTGALRHEIRVR
ncbi:MFS transporter [Limobrevibacterium gyesilva]|uniref:MFS transporter n=1 Tax=Limobrevibacterium gyesilva TaxID=2991712 RepID=A0AA41YHZ6_9PROT|nr:MFS transporter [Limobrevibacterium gyesilva]MCW3473811.1 MFS transporter [Limobrevibacterium gyesilva]